tara:strand:- start:335 stop:1303 length:969 start_codon:yes stop_codon:yes gene_type:complete
MTDSKTSSAESGESEIKAENPTELERLVEILTQELRKDRSRRRWFRVWVFVAVFVIGGSSLGWVLYEPKHQPLTYTAVIEISGLIGLDQKNMAQDLASSFEDAFSAEGTAGVVALINSPGGSPVQSGQIYRALRGLKQEYPRIPLIAVISDIGASGAYYIAAAADEIYVDPASIVGSIGVVSGGFGFVETLNKLGVERRLITAGERKAMLDPFSPADPLEEKILQEILDDIHSQFIYAVQQGRGARLKEDPDVFSGRVWSGREAVHLGLADGTASLAEVAEEILDAPVIIDFSVQQDWRSAVFDQLGVSIAKSLGLSGPHIH